MLFQSIKSVLRSMVFITTCLGVVPFALAGNKGLAYVSNQEGAVSIIDIETLNLLSEINIGAKGPRGIGITEDGKWLVTANKDSGNISVVDTTNLSATRFVSIGKNPEFVRVLDNRAYITYEPSSKSGPPAVVNSGSDRSKDEKELKIPGRIAIVDLISGKVVSEVIGKPETEGVEFSKDGSQLFVTNESDNSITVYDIKSGRLLNSIPIGSYGERPRGIKISPDGKTIVTTLEFSDKMLVLNDKFEVIKEVSTGKTPYGVSFNRTGNRIFVAANKEKALQVFDSKTFEKIKDIPTGERCWHFTFTPDDQQILLACGKSNEIIVIDVDKLEVTKHIAVKDMPWGIVTYPKSIGSLDRP
jgi:YVTN family beta-propeller protein